MPENQWQSGSVSGLVARGNFVVSESWDNGELTGATITSNNGGTCTVQVNGWEKVFVQDSEGKKVPAKEVDGKTGRITFATEEGKTYFITKTEGAVDSATVTFTAEGKTVKEVSIVKGETIGNELPTAPEKEGYTFKGWNTKEDGKGEVVTEKTVVNANMTAYAIYEKVQTPITPTPDNKPTTKPDTHPTQKPDNKPVQKPDNKPVKTSDTANVAIPFAFMLIAAVAGVIVLGKKRKTK